MVKRIKTVHFGRNTQARILALVVALACQVLHRHSVASGQDVNDPLVKFGMEITETKIGVKIAELENSRPVAKKLREGDILVSFTHVRNGEMLLSRIVNADSVDELKTAIRDGEKVVLTILRPRSNASEYEQIEIEIDAMDLMRPTEVRTMTVEVTRTQATTIGDSDHTAMVVKVHYATDRRLDPRMQYTGDRDLTPDQSTKFGICEVSIPPNHRRGQLESPTMWDWYTPNPKKHVFLAGVSQVGEAATLESIRQILSTNNASKKSVLFFVHGYNVSFEDAARRSAQLHFDLNYTGASMFFSWPSNATTSGYVSDAEDIAWSTKHITETIEKLCDQPEIDQLHIIAHSMGNRGVTSALVALAQKGKTQKIGEVVLAAADLDAETFKRDLAPTISRSIARTSVYSSSKDRALWASETLSGNPRVGEIRNGLPTIPPMERIDLIDASNVETDFMSHSYYGDVSLIGDLYTLFGSGESPPRQMLLEKPFRTGKYWRFRK